MKRALVTGITGQDGSHLAELLLDKGYAVHGLVRRTSLPSTRRIDHLLRRLHLHDGDLFDESSVRRVVFDVQPDEVYNLAAQSHVGTSFQQPELTWAINGMKAAHLMGVVHRECPAARFYQASTSEMFGAAPSPQSESTPFAPVSPYAKAKLFAHERAKERRALGLHISCGILFNHEGPRRGEEFVTRKITLGAAKIRRAIERGETPPKLKLGNLDAVRDWGYAGDYVEAAWRMLQQDKPGDYVVATGESHSVREFLERTFAWHEIPWQEHVVLDASLRRPAEVPELRGDASKACRELGWMPSVTFDGLVEMMARADWEAVR